MATIDKKLIHFNRKADFEARLAAGEIRDYSIVCIKDAKLIWTHGQYYGDLSECLKVTEQTLTDAEKAQVLGNLGIEIPAKVSELENDSNFVSAVDTGEEVDDVEVNYVTESELTSELAKKQSTLVSGTNIKTINGASILGSGNIVISGGSSSGGGGAYAEVNHGTSDTSFTLTPNTFHVWDEVSSLDLSFAEEQEGVANEYLFQFTSGATATTLTLPDVKWASDSAPTIAENMIYQISVLKGLASVLEFSNPIVFPIVSLSGSYPEVYSYFTTQYTFPSTSTKPSSGILISEELYIEGDDDISGKVIKIGFDGSFLVLWTESSLNSYYVLRMSSSGLTDKYFWD